MKGISDEKMSDKVGNVRRPKLLACSRFLLSLDFKFVNNSKKEIENVDMLIVVLHVSPSSQYKISIH